MNKFAKLLGFTLLSVVLSACCVPSSETGAKTARSLSQADLQGIYAIMEQHKEEYVTWGPRDTPLPEAFARAGVIHGDVGHLDRLVLGGCMDDKAFLIFDGLRRAGARQIRLIPGERKEPEVLWRELEMEVNPELQ